MNDFIFLLACRDKDGNQYVAECDSWQVEVGALAEVDGTLLEVTAVNHMEVAGDEYSFVAHLHELKQVTAIYRKVYQKSKEDSQDGTDAD